MGVLEEAEGRCIELGWGVGVTLRRTIKSRIHECVGYLWYPWITEI